MTASNAGIGCRPVGDRALLLDLTDAIAAAGPNGAALPAAVAAALRELSVEGRVGENRLADVVPAATTVLVRFTSGPGSQPPSGVTDGRVVTRAVAAVAAFRSSGPTSQDQPAAELVVPVHYDGPDLADVAATTGLTVDEVVAAHTGTAWTAAFVGFAPGFAYLTGGDPRLRVPRRPQPRTSIPPGSVALAGEYSAVYPRESPGGWQIIGTTDLPLWDESADPPALVRPGQRVRFIAANETNDAATDVDHAGHEGPAAGSGVPALTVVRPGPLALLQDGGRSGRAADGVGPSGPADRVAHARANRLVGNDPAATAVECTLGGLTVRAETDLVVALAGAPAPATVDGEPIPPDAAVPLAAGATLRLRAPRTGLRTYLAVAGLVGRPVLGSTSTDTLARLGPDALRVGDQLAVDRECGGRATSLIRGPHDAALEPAARSDDIPVLTVRLGPRDDWFADASALLHGEWVVSPQSNRVGVRLDRPTDADPDDAPPLARSRNDELPSEGLVRGAIQVPPSGQPVLFLADHPLTGGYPVVAVVLDGNVDRVGQLRPGQRLRFVLDAVSSGG